MEDKRKIKLSKLEGKSDKKLTTGEYFRLTLRLIKGDKNGKINDF